MALGDVRKIESGEGCADLSPNGVLQFPRKMWKLFDELIEGQRGKVLATAKRIVPHVTEEDLLQPNDFPELELHPHFRYEEGILDGLQVAKAAFLAFSKESSIS